MAHIVATTDHTARLGIVKQAGINTNPKKAVQKQHSSLLNKQQLAHIAASLKDINR